MTRSCTDCDRGHQVSTERWLVKTQHYPSGGKWHISAGTMAAPDCGANNCKPLGDVGLCGRLDPTDRYCEVRGRGEVHARFVCADCRRIEGRAINSHPDCGICTALEAELVRSGGTATHTNGVTCHEVVVRP